MVLVWLHAVRPFKYGNVACGNHGGCWRPRRMLHELRNELCRIWLRREQIDVLELPGVVLIVQEGLRVQLLGWPAAVDTQASAVIIGIESARVLAELCLSRGAEVLESRPSVLFDVVGLAHHLGKLVPVATMLLPKRLRAMRSPLHEAAVNCRGCWEQD